MPDDVLIPPLPHPIVLLAQPPTVQQRKDTDVKMK
jgi:hypothetical protein